MEYAGVFGSTCGTETIRTENNLLELLQQKVVLDEPLEQDVTEVGEIPNILEKKQNTAHKLKPKIKKVKTVRDIRNEYEKYVYENLKPDLDKQKKALYDKIRNGSLRKDTIDVVTKILNSGDSITRTTWNMITHLNPNNNLFNKQYALYNGLKIKINGSLGGSKDIIYNDIYLKIKSIGTRKHEKKIRKKSLLYNSPASNFRPGPLSKKYLLDKSYQKYNIGDSEIINLPKISLEIEPKYGAVLEPRITNYISGMREENGVLTKKWTEFATSVVGTVVNNTVVQCAKDVRIKFDVGYKNNQNRMLMRNFNEYDNRKMHCTKENKKRGYGNKLIPVVVKSVVDKLIESVIVSINQDAVDYDLNIPNELESEISYLKNDREKVKRNAELERLDVTIIRLAEDGFQENMSCGKLYCKFGCICSSLQCRFVIRDHCGKEECMFNCTCNYVKRVTERDLGYNSELINLNNKLHPRLAKEEQKFHQTVVVSSDVSILLNSHKRNIHHSAYIPELSNNQLRELTLTIMPLSLKNVQTFCMVHELYKCFCKNRFVDSFYNNCPTVESNNSINSTTNIDVCNFKSIIDEDIEKTENAFHTNEVDEDFVYKQPKYVNGKNKTNRIKKKPVPLLCGNALNSNHTRDLDVVQLNTYVDSTIRSTQSESFSKLDYNEMILEINIDKDFEKPGDEYTMYKQLKPINGENKKNPKPLSYNNSNNNSNHTMDVDIVQINTNIDSCCRVVPYSGRKLSPQRYKMINSSIKKFEESDIRLANKLMRYQIETSGDDILDELNVNTPDTSTTKSIQGESISKLHDDENLRMFLESHYKQYKKRVADGKSKLKMDSPVQGRHSLIPWNVLLERYKNKSNCFFVTTSNPYRVFMSVDPKIIMLEKCININDIKVCDLHKYPMPVKKLITQESNDNEEFCISYAQAGYLELKGCAEKLDQEHVQGCSDSKNDKVSEDNDNHNSRSSLDIEDCTKTKYNNKWFLMELEEGFEVVRLVKKGFFVKSHYLLKSIDLARLSGKLKKLSPVVPNLSKENGPQFGIYIIPVLGKSHILIGPYGMHEDHGIELKFVNALHQFENVKGQWITTKKEENKTILFNPFMFISHTNMPANMKNQEGSISEKKIPPIKIKLNNTRTFLVVNSQGVLKPMSMVKPSVKDNDVNTQTSNTLPVQTTAKLQIPSTPIERLTFNFPESKDEPAESMSAAHNSTANIDTIVLSDEEEGNKPSTDQSSYTPVWIQCVSIKNLGCLLGKKNKNNKISFKFPIIKPTPFLSECEAFIQINKILSRLVYVPQNIEIKWQVVEKANDLINRNLLNIKDLGRNYILTEEGIIHRSKLSEEERMKLLLPAASVGTTETINP